MKILWDMEARRIYKKRTEEEQTDKGERSIEEEWRELKERVQEAMVKKEVMVKRHGIGHKIWWDRGCTIMKRMVQRACRKWRRGKMDTEKFLEKRKAWKYTEEKKKEAKDMEEEEIKNLRNETEVWNFINKRKERREWIENSIGREE